MKSGRIGNSKSFRPDSSRSTERPVLMAQSDPLFCSSRISSMHCRSNTGSLTRETIVPSKSVLRSLIFARMRINEQEQEQEQESNEISLGTRDGTFGERCADCFSDGRSKKGARRSRFDLQGEDRGKRSLPEGSNRESAGRRQVR